tara:strand:+ start:293 stop:508 length:216 start_codon:yes stop_codon:yes gene_type:complete
MKSINKIIIMKEFLFVIMLLFSNVFSVNDTKPDFGKMMNQKREEIKRLREANINPDRRFRYNEKYKTKPNL